MATSGSITSAGVVLVLIVPGLFPTPIQIQGFSPEKAFSTTDLQVTESVMGVDGQKSSGWTPMIVSQEVSLMADSQSRQVVNAIYRAQVANRDVLTFNGTVTYPSTGETFVGTNGSIKSLKVMPDAAKILQPVSFTIEWESLSPALV